MLLQFQEMKRNRGGLNVPISQPTLIGWPSLLCCLLHMYTPPLSAPLAIKSPSSKLGIIVSLEICATATDEEGGGKEGEDDDDDDVEEVEEVIDADDDEFNVKARWMSGARNHGCCVKVKQ